jgi:hypothetical protein
MLAEGMSRCFITPSAIRSILARNAGSIVFTT